MTLYLKYRPQTIEELDLTKVRESLQKIVASESIPHAFLLSGPRGSGKTSAARILAKVVNCEKPVKTNFGSIEPCNKCSQCIAINKSQNVDIIEMDAASNRGIDDIRSLRERVALAPAHAKVKVYILDEAHMLTNEAANALLKTLEEPPSHVLFMLATTEPHKLPETVRSRLTHIPFQKANESEILRQLARVSKGEGFQVDNDVLKNIAERSDGSFREAVKILEELVILHGPEIKNDILSDSFHYTAIQVSEEILKHASKKDIKEIFQLIQSYESMHGADGMMQLVDQIILCLRKHSHSVAKVSNEESKFDFALTETVELIEKLLDAKTKIMISPVSSIPVELVFLEGQKKPDKNKPERSSKSFEKKTEESVKPVKVEPGKPLDHETWNRILNEVREKNASIEALLRAAKPLGVEGEVLNLGVYYSFHKERLELAQMRRVLEDTISEVLGSVKKFECTLTEKPKDLTVKKDPPLTDTNDEDIITAAKEIFGN